MHLKRKLYLIAQEIIVQESNQNPLKVFCLNQSNKQSFAKVLNNNESEAGFHVNHTPSVQKVLPFVKEMVQNFQARLYPYKAVSIDEIVVGWKGRFKHKTYNAKKA